MRWCSLRGNRKLYPSESYLRNQDFPQKLRPIRAYSKPVFAAPRTMSFGPFGTIMQHSVTHPELARPFLPTKDISVSKRFYETLGFELTLDSDVVIFRVGHGGFILQRHFDEGWAENCMMQLMVDDLDRWWAHIASLDLPGRFGVSPPKPPATQPWGLRVAFVIDPAGVLWHVAQRRAGAAQDI